MSEYHLAQANIGRMLAAKGAPEVQGFFDALDRINSLAERSTGFVWRLKDEDGADATAIQPSIDPLLLVNMSVWQDAEALFDFVYRSDHTPIMAQRKHWFERFDGPYQVLWWVPAGHQPSVDEAFAKLWHLEKFGPTPHAFTFKSRFPVPGIAGDPVDMNPDPWCEGRA